MIRDIVVNLNVAKGGGPVGDYAVSIADALEAHLAGVVFVYDPIVPVSVTGYIPAEVVERQQADNEASAKTALDRFAEATRRAALSAEPLRINASLAGAGEHFARIARRFDLAVVGQAEPETSSVDDIIAETTLFESGRPMIVVPYIQKGPLKLDKVMVCWDGSRQAARAIGDAMPLLAKAGKVEIIIITNEPGKQDEIEGVDIGQHLARHGLKIEVERIPGGDVDVADALLSHAADSGADFMVMGGYGHSRLREFVLGGVTHSIFQSMTVPVLMSH
ncbi:MAG TPA: universal stress protein [Xanthobacteraceae bacterium]|nr:universal stress protein [Xanthobacteraceae bacterium]